MIELPMLAIMGVIIVALIFDFTNGFHDAANSIATVVSTKVLSMKQAVCFAAFFNFIAAAAIGVAVANTISKIVSIKVVGASVIPWVVLCALIGAISWNIITWYFGMPSSSSHAIVGGLLGAGLCAAGVSAISWTAVTTTVQFMILSPLVGIGVGFLAMSIINRLTKKIDDEKKDPWFRRLQLFSSAAYSFSHGTNDAQKTMGLIIPLLFSMGYFGVAADPAHLPVPLWVILAAHGAIAIGTLAGGWRIVHTLGYKIMNMKPKHGFAAETAGSITILTASSMGIPVSTTHVICSTVVGVGATKGKSYINWGTVKKMICAWVLTIPSSAVIGFVSFTTFSVLLG